MAKAGIAPAAIDLVVLSHQHWDHTGGIYHVLHTNARVQIFLPQSFSTHFKQDLQRYGAELIEVHDTAEICPGVYSTGDLLLVMGGFHLMNDNEAAIRNVVSHFLGDNPFA
jgi:7,8-dihydropterin-6-yl-methyl-4-(beta-D-ribofuranosyl)aminobenzene 5'-phosphate synthase